MLQEMSFSSLLFLRSTPTERNKYKHNSKPKGFHISINNSLRHNSCAFFVYNASCSAFKSVQNLENEGLRNLPVATK